MIDELKKNEQYGYQYAKEFEWAFKVRDKEDADSWKDAKGLMLLPKQRDIPKNIVEQSQEFVSKFTRGVQSRVDSLMGRKDATD